MEHSEHYLANRNRKFNLVEHGLTDEEQKFLTETLQKITDLKFSIMPLEN